MGNLTEICNQADNIQNPLHATEHTEEGHFTQLQVSQSSQQLQQEINELRQQEDFREFCANKVLKKHNEREEYYLGQWQDGYRKGQALMFRPTEYLYLGEVDRVPQGRGKLILYQQNIVIQGEMRNGKPEGHCNIRDLNDLFTYEGLISSQQLPTSGRFQVNNPTSPQKSYAIILDQYPTNKATIQFRDGGRYIGEISFESLLQHGEGEERYGNNAVYVGGWNNGQYHGKGKFTWSDGSSYEGDYVNGIKQGQGVYVYASKKVYKGDWVNGKQEGQGLLLSPQGKTLKRGIWSTGSYVRAEDEVQF